MAGNRNKRDTVFITGWDQTVYEIELRSSIFAAGHSRRDANDFNGGSRGQELAGAPGAARGLRAACFRFPPVAALLPADAVSFVHDPAAGETTYERFVSLEFPKEVRKRAIGGISAAQQAQDYQLLENLSVVPVPTGDAGSDPAGKLSAWLLSQTDLSGSSA